MKAYTDLLYEMVRDKNPCNIIVECGVGEGYSTLAILKAMNEKKDCRMYSIDIRHWSSGLNRIRDNADIKNWDAIIEDDLLFAKHFFKKIDILYIDSHHFEKETYDELEAFLPLLNKDAIILMHDTLHNTSTNEHGWNVMPAIYNFLDRNKEYKFTELLPEDEGNCGFGIIKKREL